MTIFMASTFASFPMPGLSQLMLLLLMLSLATISAADKEMSVYVDAGKKECYFQNVSAGQMIDIEYQVIDGGHGDLDISFTLADPIGMIIVSDFKKSDYVHRHQAEKTGDYRFCFDNTFSSFNRKTIFFEIIVEMEGETNLGDDQFNDPYEGLRPEEFYDMKINDIMDYLGNIRAHLNKVRHLQDMLRSVEARDRNLAEANFNRVNAWSAFQICAMITVGLVQVFLVRSIFDTDSRMTQFWQRVKL